MMLDSQMSAPSGVNPAFRTRPAGDLVPRVRLTNRPLPTWLTHVSMGPSRSDRKTTNRPSREIAASFSAPSKSVNRVNGAFASGLSADSAFVAATTTRQIRSARPERGRQPTATARLREATSEGRRSKSRQRLSTRPRAGARLAGDRPPFRASIDSDRPDPVPAPSRRWHGAAAGSTRVRTEVTVQDLLQHFKIGHADKRPRPASNSYITMPNENTSLRASSGFAPACSGDMYAMVPTITP